jgi:hypothetical protein
MNKSPKQRKDDPEQLRLLVEVAKQYEADTEEMPAVELLRRITTKPPKPHNN